MVVPDKPNEALIMSHESTRIQNHKNGERGGDATRHKGERDQGPEPLELRFEPVAIIGVQNGRNNFSMMNTVNRIQESCM